MKKDINSYDKKQRQILGPFILRSPPSNIDLNLLPDSQLKLEDMITLSVMSCHHRSGTIIKAIHAPSLKIFAIKQIPMNTRDVRQSLLDWIKR